MGGEIWYRNLGRNLKEEYVRGTCKRNIHSRTHPGGTQHHPEGTQEAPRGHPGGTQEHPGGSQEASWPTRRPGKAWDRWEHEKHWKPMVFLGFGAKHRADMANTLCFSRFLTAVLQNTCVFLCFWGIIVESGVAPGPPALYQIRQNPYSRGLFGELIKNT